MLPRFLVVSWMTISHSELIRENKKTLTGGQTGVVPFRLLGWFEIVANVVHYCRQRRSYIWNLFFSCGFANFNLVVFYCSCSFLLNRLYYEAATKIKALWFKVAKVGTETLTTALTANCLTWSKNVQLIPTSLLYWVIWSSCQWLIKRIHGQALIVLRCTKVLWTHWFWKSVLIVFRVIDFLGVSIAGLGI